MKKIPAKSCFFVLSSLINDTFKIDSRQNLHQALVLNHQETNDK